jgi:hypothetical protein
MSALERRRPDDDVLDVFRHLPRPGPKFALALGWWALGLYALHFAAAPYQPSVLEEQRYNDKMSRAVFSVEARQAERNLMAAQRALDEVHVWGWRWREPYSRLVPERQARLDHALADFRLVSAERNALISEAKSSVGIWSPQGISEVRATFWGDYEWGKDFAKRMSFWDVVFGLGRSNRDEELVVVLLRWLGQIMMNFTVGFLSALVAFTFSLLKLLWLYKTGLLSGALFFAVAMTGASAMVALVVGGMYTTAVGGVYLVARSAQQARLEGGQAGRLRYVRNRHYDHVD